MTKRIVPPPTPRQRLPRSRASDASDAADAAYRVTAELRHELRLAMASDWLPLSRRVDRLASMPPDAPQRQALQRSLAASIAASVERVQRRAAGRPVVSYPSELPVSARRDEIASAIRAHQVVIVCGETGSGKTTQLPKICLDVGRGTRGLIGHTQPRRIAARTVATRIAAELGGDVGGAVGYKVRFTDHTRPDAYLKIMTDGILLAETQSDRTLAAYDTLIIDEAHERSLNIDFLLGYLKRLLRERPDLKLIVTSATLDVDRFAAHFAGDDGTPAPVIEVSGRMYPVDVRYRPLGPTGLSHTTDAAEADDEEDLEEAIVTAAEDLWREAPGDILVFLPGEREIRETAELLTRSMARRPYGAAVEILPLYARLSVEQQQRVFAPSDGRRIVLATNVAETSLTVPGIRYVIDSGLARVKRYSLRNKVTLLQIENIAQSAADQRAGRCGRVAAGVCVRLYSAAALASRPKFTDPEIRRSSLAAVILRMAALHLGEIDAFPFLERPSPRQIADGYQLLHELGAVTVERALTALGAELAKLPVDPRIGRMILAAKESGCLAETLVIASALAVPDPRERPIDKRQAADQAHLRFRDERSDFLSLLALWQFFADALAAKQSHRKLVEQCRAHFVSYLRLREWRDLHRQLTEQITELGWRWTERLPDDVDKSRYEMIHRSLLAGLLSNIGCKDEADESYAGARGLRFWLHPGVGIARKGAKWVLAAELTDTTRLYARCAARIEPEWIEQVAGSLVDRAYFDPRWDPARGEVIAAERVSLYGLTLEARRRVSYGTIDPVAAHDVFLREALSTGALITKAPFLAYNRQLIAAIADLENKARRNDVLVDDEAIHAFYAERVPAGVVSAVTFERWREVAEKREPRLLYMTREALMRHAAAGITEAQYPETMTMAGAELALKYRFSPGHPLDGLTLTAPLALLNQLDAAKLSWLVPGMIRDKVTWYLKALPKAWRSRLTPVPEIVTAFLENAARDDATRGDLADALRAFCNRRLRANRADSSAGTTDLPPDAWEGSAPPGHLLMNIRIVDAANKELGQGRDLAALRAQLGEAAQLSFAAAGPELERTGIKTWDFGDLPETLSVTRAGRQLTGFPALVDEDAGIALRLQDTRAGADAATRAALVRLIRIQLKDALQRWEKNPPGFAAAALQLKTVIASDALLADVLDAVGDRAFIGDDPIPRSERAFAEQTKRARTRLPAVIEAAFKLLGSIAAAHFALTQRLTAMTQTQNQAQMQTQTRLAADVRAQRGALVYPGFFAATPWSQLTHLPRYLHALERRLAKFAADPGRDARHAATIGQLWDRFRARDAANRAAKRVEPALEDFRWHLEELKVSLFAQELRTPYPVSIKRLEKAWTDFTRR